MNLNKVFLIGRLTQDPEARSTASGQNVTTLRLATNRVWSDPSGQKKDSTEYHTVVAWGRLGEIANQYLKKGGLVMIEGRLQTRNWTGQDNLKRYYTEVIAESLQLGPRTSGSGMAGERPSSNLEDIKKSTIAEVEIPIIDENEPTTSGLTSQGVDEDEISIKEKDLPF